MLSAYTPLVLGIFVVWVYAYFNRVFLYVLEGGAYLSFLYDNPEKLNTPVVMDVLINRDIPMLQAFLDQRSKIFSILISALIINVIIYIFYPYDTLLYPWMEYILIAGFMISNTEVFRVFIHLRRNKRITTNMCNSYYMLEQEQKNLKKQTELMILSFEDLVEKVNEALDEEKDTDSDNEK